MTRRARRARVPPKWWEALLDFKYAGYGLDVAWTRLPDDIRSAAVGHRRSGPMAIQCRFAEPSSFRLLTSGFFVANVRAKMPFEVTVGDIVRKIEGRALFVIGPDQPIRTVFSGPHEGEFISMSAESIEAVLGPGASYQIASAICADGEDHLVRPLADAVTTCMAQKEDVCALAYEAIVVAILRLLVRGTAVKRPSALTVDQACAVRALILDGLAEPLSVGDLARAVHLSEGHFARAFKESFGAAPYNYILRERVLRARTLLGEKRLSLEDVARQVGFSSPAQMTRALKSHVGGTARALRGLGRSRTASGPVLDRAVSP